MPNPPHQKVPLEHQVWVNRLARRARRAHIALTTSALVRAAQELREKQRNPRPNCLECLFLDWYGVFSREGEDECLEASAYYSAQRRRLALLVYELHQGQPWWIK